MGPTQWVLYLPYGSKFRLHKLTSRVELKPGGEYDDEDILAFHTIAFLMEYRDSIGGVHVKVASRGGVKRWQRW